MGFTFTAEDMENLDGGDLPTPGGGDNGESKTPTPTPTLQTPPEPFRFGDDAPEDLRGKTAAEVAQLYSTTREAARVAFEQLRATPPAPAAPPAARKEEVDLTAEDLMGTDPDKVNQKLNKLFESKAAPVIGELLQNQSQQMYTIMRTHPSLPYFQKYEQEILAAAAKLPVAATAKAETWQLLYQTSVAQHLPEILAESRRSWEQESKGPPPVERGRGGPPLQQRRGITPEQQQVARNLGVSDEEYLKYAVAEE